MRFTVALIALALLTGCAGAPAPTRIQSAAKTCGATSDVADSGRAIVMTGRLDDPGTLAPFCVISALKVDKTLWSRMGRQIAAGQDTGTERWDGLELVWLRQANSLLFTVTETG